MNYKRELKFKTTPKTCDLRDFILMSTLRFYVCGGGSEKSKEKN